MALLHKEITERIIEACYEVANELGAGFLESVYEKALLVALGEKGIDAASQVPMAVSFRGQNVGEFFADIIVESKIVVEVKAVKRLLPEHSAQVINYLKATGMEVGLLVNFGGPKVEIKRLHG